MEEIVHCPACGTKVGLGKEFCTACGGAMSPTSRASQAAPEVPKPAVDSAAPAHVPPPAANVNNADESWVKRHKGLSIILAIAVIGGGISIISSLSNSDSPSASATADGISDGVAGGNADEIPEIVDIISDTPSCSPETLFDLVNHYVALQNRTLSAWSAIPDVLTDAAGSKRLKIRFARESAQERKIMNECVTVSDSTAATELLIAIAVLQDASSTLYTYYRSYLDADTGTIERVNERNEARNVAVDRFNAAWEAFGDEQGFEIDQTPTPPLDESKVAD